jgi:hypothetical protein
MLSNPKYSLDKLTEFLHENNVLNAPASDIDGFLPRDAVLPPFI